MLQKLSQNETLADRSYREIKHAIIKGKLQPGDSLPEETIASMLGVSRTPLRKAITRLAFEGLVELETGKIARVAAFLPQDIENFLQLRKLLEPFNLEQITPRASREFIDHLKQLLNEQRKALVTQDYDLWAELDADFHIALTKINPNTKLQQFIEQLHTGLHRRYVILSGTLEECAEIAHYEHEMILQALISGDPNEASETMKSHIQNIEDRIRITK